MEVGDTLAEKCRSYSQSSVKEWAPWVEGSCELLSQAADTIESLMSALTLCHDTMHETIAVLSYSDSQKVADVMEIARNALASIPQSKQATPSFRVEEERV